MIDYKSLGLSEEDLKVIYKWMDLGRKIDERLWLLNRAGKIPFVVSGQGQEATQIGMAYALEEGDITAPYYRCAFVYYRVSQRMIRFYQRLERKTMLTLVENKCHHTLVVELRIFCLKVHR